MDIHSVYSVFISYYIQTTDGYTLRVFCIGFTKKQELSQKKTCYAQSQQVKYLELVLNQILFIISLIFILTYEVSPGFYEESFK